MMHATAQLERLFRQIGVLGVILLVQALLLCIIEISDILYPNTVVKLVIFLGRFYLFGSIILLLLLRTQNQKATEKIEVVSDEPDDYSRV